MADSNGVAALFPEVTGTARSLDEDGIAPFDLPSARCTLESVERAMIQEALRLAGANVSEPARVARIFEPQAASPPDFVHGSRGELNADKHEAGPTSFPGAA